jgi:hypothetical protein
MEVADVGELTRSLLNDIEGQLYNNTVLLPYIKLAYGEAEKELNVNGISTTKEIMSSLPIPKGMTAITINDINDMVLPLDLGERTPGATSFIPMTMRSWDTTSEPSGELRYWVWRENEIKLLGATADREVQVRYIKGFPVLTNENSPIMINSSLEYLAYRTASLASRYIGGNKARADSLELDSGRLLPKMVAAEVKNQQSMPVRRRPFRYRF